MTLILTITTVLLLVFTLLPLSQHPHWLVRSLDFPRMQLAFLALLLLVVQIFVLEASPWKIGLIGVTAACLIWQLWWILPYTPLWSTEVKTALNSDEDCKLSIMTANVLGTNRDSKRLIELVLKYKPDVLVTLESNHWWQEQLSVLEKEMPHTEKCPLENLYGMHVYSRLPMSETSIDFLIQKDIPSIHSLLRLRNGELVRFHFLHPAPPSPTENKESTERDAELVMVARSIAANNAIPTVVTGDLNDVAWSATTRLFRKLSGLLDPRIGRGMFNTFHADYPFLRWPLDHLFHSKDFTVNSIRRMPSIGSDHFALLTSLTYSPARGATQEGIKADADDYARASEIAEDGR